MHISMASLPPTVMSTSCSCLLYTSYNSNAPQQLPLTLVVGHMGKILFTHSGRRVFRLSLIHI